MAAAAARRPTSNAALAARATVGAGRSPAARRAFASTRIPDGVAKVTFVIPRDSSPGEYAGPVYRQALYVTVPVRGNIAAIEEAHRQLGGSMPEIWYASDGRVIKRVGDFAVVNRVTAAPKPGPETAQSLAAERDPSTPNPVWVSPAVGGPHTRFTIHFRVLLNGADYHYRFTGTDCPGFTFTGGTGKPNALRGSRWSDGVSAVQGRALCPGTYHVAVSVFDLGRAGYIHQPGKPFGTARSPSPEARQTPGRA